MNKDFLWVERYRPSKIEDCIISPQMKRTFSEVVRSGNVPNMLFSGSPGTGKTTAAKAICDELNIDYIMINASKDGNIDTLRTKIQQFASTVSFSGGIKVVILDEADYLNPQSTQPALRGFIEEFSNNCRFILTCNMKSRIIEPLHSRLAYYDFSVAKKDLPIMAGMFAKRLFYILDTEKAAYDKKAVLTLISTHMPDWRKVITTCQNLSIGGAIDAGTLTSLGDENFKGLMKSLKERDFKRVRQWVADNSDVDPIASMRMIYDTIYTYVSPESIPSVVLILADYQYKAAFVADQELNLVACFVEIMGEASWL